jgi:predicted DNA-binding transcriptional regulator AlpA
MKSIEPRPDRAVKPVRFINSTAVCARFGWSKTTLWRARQRDRDFPAPCEVSPGAVAWVEHEIDAYAEKLVARRDAGHLPALVASGQRLGRSGLGGRPRGSKTRDKRQLSLLDTDSN